MASTSLKGPSPLAASTIDEDVSRTLRVLVVHARWNTKIIEALLEGVRQSLGEAGVQESSIVTESVPGSYELPFACQSILLGKQKQARLGPWTASTAPYDVCIAVGVLIKGSTAHFEYIADSVTHALQTISLKTETPIVFGLLTCFTEKQALERAGIGGHNHGLDWGSAAVEMAIKTRAWHKGA